MVSYADFVTLLFVLFVALYALLSHRMQQTTQVSQPTTVVQAAAVDPALLREQARRQMVELLRVQLAGLMHLGEVRLTEKRKRIVLEISEKALFARGEAEPSERAAPVIQALAEALSAHHGNIKVEGHTDDIPMQSRQYPSNWELSAARAAAVVRLLERYGVEASRLSATGLADTQPVAIFKTEEARALNRRVNLVLYDR